MQDHTMSQLKLITHATALEGQTRPVKVEILDAAASARQRAEQFVHDVFASAYAASVSSFMPQLMTLHNAGGGLQAALGMRAAHQHRLFLETYLDAPIEAVLATAINSNVDELPRHRIMEIGNLAALHAGSTRSLIIALTAYLQGAGYDWVVFTAVPSLRNSFRKLGLRMFTLGIADKTRLSESEQQTWGSYHDTAPIVVAVNVHHTFGVLERTLRLELTLQRLTGIWQAAYDIGATTFAATPCLTSQNA